MFLFTICFIFLQFDVWDENVYKVRLKLKVTIRKISKLNHLKKQKLFKIFGH